MTTANHNRNTANTEGGAEQTAEKSQVSAPAEFGLLGPKPSENLQAIRELNGQTRAVPEQFGQLTLSNGSNERHPSLPWQVAQSPEWVASTPDRRARLVERTMFRTEQTKIGQTEYSITRDTSANPREFSNDQGRWVRPRGDDTWVNAGDRDHPRFMRGTPSIDPSGNFVFRNSDFGTTQTSFRDGRNRAEIETSNGTRYAVETEQRNGKRVATRFEDHSGGWTSIDGSTWRNERGDTRRGVPSISAFGEFNFNFGNGDRTSITERAESRQLSEARAIERQILDEHRVAISTPGMRHEHGVTDQPSVRELRALNDVLERTRHMLQNDRGNGQRPVLTVSFLGRKNMHEIEEDHGAYANNRLDLYQNSRIDPEGWLGIKGTGLHELVHHEQEKMGSDYWRGRNPGQEVSGLRSGHGWLSDGLGRNVMLDWRGGRWLPQEGPHIPGVGPTTNWRWAGGTPPEDGSLDRVRTAQEMENRFLVRQAGPYNLHPYESHAESAAMFRFSPERLAEKSPHLYLLIRNWDQKKLDVAFGVGRMMRGVDGRIVENTEQNRRLRNQMEQRYGI